MKLRLMLDGEGGQVEVGGELSGDPGGGREGLEQIEMTIVPESAPVTCPG